MWRDESVSWRVTVCSALFYYFYFIVITEHSSLAWFIDNLSESSTLFIMLFGMKICITYHLFVRSMFSQIIHSSPYSRIAEKFLLLNLFPTVHDSSTNNEFLLGKVGIGCAFINYLLHYNQKEVIGK